MNKLNLRGVSTIVWVRAIMTVITAVNIILGYIGYHLIPLTEGEVGEIVNGAVVIVTALVWAWGWWKNNSLTYGAQLADIVKAEVADNETNE